MSQSSCPGGPAEDLLEQEGRVVAVAGGIAWIETRRQSACGGCGQASACAVPMLGGALPGAGASRIELPDHLGLAVGERVVLGLPSGLLIRAAALAYLVPPLVLVLSAGLAGTLGAGELGTAAAGVTGLALGLGLVGLITGRATAPRGWRPVLVGRVVSAATDNSIT